MRLFIAINLNDEMKDALMDIQDFLWDHGIHGRETVSENMHLTLAFIGDYDDPDQVKEIVESIEVRPFEMSLKGIGAFRDLWWVGVDNAAPLMAISRRLRRALADSNVPFDKKKFSPHITIVRRGEGRLSDEARGKMSGEVQGELEGLFGASMIVDHISLMRSERGRNGMIYTEL